MLQEAQLFFIVLIFFEFFELFWQKGSNIQEYVKNLFYFYKKSVLLFIILHPSLYLSILAQIALGNFSFFASAISVLKLLDLCFKLSLMDKLYKKKNLGLFVIMLKENMPLSKLLKFSGVLLYCSLFYFGYLFS